MPRPGIAARFTPEGRTAGNDNEEVYKAKEEERHEHVPANPPDASSSADMSSVDLKVVFLGAIQTSPLGCVGLHGYVLTQVGRAAQDRATWARRAWWTAT